MKGNYNLIIGIGLFLILLVGSFLGSNGLNATTMKPTPNEGDKTSLSSILQLEGSAGYLEYTPTDPPDLLTRTRTHDFILKTQNVPENNATNIDQIYYRLGAIRILDPTLGNISQSLKQYWINQILSFQRTNGGFGSWKRDFASLSSTYKAIQSLTWLGYTGLNGTVVTGFLDRLRNSLTNGYNSHLLDSDSDVYSTHLAVLTFDLLGSSPPNASDVAQVFIRAQNLGANVSTVESGGFGKQTNRFAIPPIYWTSEVTVTRAAIIGLVTLNYTLAATINTTEALTFLKNLQDGTTGGWFNTPYDAPTSPRSASHTAAALEAISLLGGTPSDPTGAKNFLLSLETPEGGFRLSTISSSASLKGTFFSLKGLELLGATPSNVTKTLEWLLNWTPNQGGFGGFPGDDASLRETFDAVYALSLSGRPIPHRQEILNFVSSYRNPDGGYGLTGSNVESTFRAVTIYSLLGEPFPNASQTIAFLQSLQQTDGGFIKRPGASPSYVISTYRAVAALNLLNATPSNVLGAIAFLQSNQNSDGGFGGFNNDPVRGRDTSDVSSTYRAVRALALLNATPTDINGAISFLQGSQNPDGGFKRSSYDFTRPNNISGAVYTYSAVRALLLLGSKPLNISGLYDYIVSLRNIDGGFGEHDGFTSDIAYVFTSLWLLAHISEISGFSLLIPDNLNQSRLNQDNFTLTIKGSIGPLNYTVTNLNTSTILANGSLSSPSNVTIDTSVLPAGSYQLQVLIIDGTRAQINVTVSLLIEPSTSTTTPSSTTSASNTTNIGTNSTTSTSIPSTTTTSNPVSTSVNTSSSSNSSSQPQSSTTTNTTSAPTNYSTIGLLLGLVLVSVILPRIRKHEK